MAQVPDGKTVLEAYDRLDRSNRSAVESYNALSYAYFLRDDVEEFAPGRVVVRMRPECGPVQLVVLDEWSSTIGDPHERRRVYLKARERGEL